ncbi:MAG: DUF2281 domain-containing protein [Deltaproteobacteria bacterium]|jgi:hypothetical protein|nr:DUF2281 domain-containing protein [Deltaproteobacteria bacterium]
MYGRDLLINEIDKLPEELLPEVLDFIKLLESRENIASTSQFLSEKAFEKIWDNSEDAIYDSL